jgi:predicted RNase H-like nuclease (RuvC/YqgF family)
MREKEHFEELKVSEQNFISLEQKYDKLNKFYKKVLKVQNKDLKDLDDKLSDILFEINSLQQYTREKEKEREMADSRYGELKKTVKHQGLLPLSDEKK